MQGGVTERDHDRTAGIGVAKAFLDLAVEGRQEVQRLANDRADLELARRFDLLVCVPGIGERTALTLAIRLPELGPLSREEIAALVGVGAFDVQSSLHKRAARIKGGRSRVLSSILRQNPSQNQVVCSKSDPYQPTMEGVSSFHCEDIVRVLISRGPPCCVAAFATSPTSSVIHPKACRVPSAAEQVGLPP